LQNGEKKAKLKFQKKMTKLASQTNKKKTALPKSKKRNLLKCKSKASVNKHGSSEEEVDLDEERTNDVRCQACHSTEEDDEAVGIERLWIQCDACNSWMHADC
jgi:aspartate carbamoyltransferase regulatory subunit